MTSSLSRASVADGRYVFNHGKAVVREPSMASISASRSPSTMSKTGAADVRIRGSNRSSNGSSRTTSSVAPSQQSPFAPSYRTVNGTRKPRRLRSQYPRDGGESHVEYILVASFDIDRGPIMENQYPGAIKGDQHMLAELMLPDQAHVRNQDWTIFFLHKDPNAERQERNLEGGSLENGDAEQFGQGSEQPGHRRQINGNHGDDANENGIDDDEEHTGSESVAAGAGVAEEAKEEEEDEDEDEDEEDEEPEGGPPLVYVLNLVNTKQDLTVRR